ncbi:MAG: helix-turn-helix domain-containing protein [Planctomycetota bacterium]|jgi:excisionase family DNA binding protein
MLSEPQEWLSTGQAAKFCSVKPDTILKWIKRGKLNARRTAGGHYRIQRRELEPLILTPPGASEAQPRASPGQPLRCWEYLGGGNAPDKCMECIVYRSRAAWCFQMVELARELGHSRNFCAESCEDCTYYQRVRGLPTAVLVVTADPALRDRLALEESEGLRVRFAESGYEASAIIHDFRPAFVVIDHDLLRGPEEGLLDRLAGDPRVPGVRVVLAAGKGRAARVRAAVRNDAVVGVVEKPLEAGRLASVIDAFPVEVSALDEGG